MSPSVRAILSAHSILVNGLRDAAWTPCARNNGAGKVITPVRIASERKAEREQHGSARIPAFNARGEPLHHHGVSEVPGLYFLGLQWLSRMKSAFLSGVGDDATVLADHIAARG
jgi:hypothetical protein